MTCTYEDTCPCTRCDKTRADLDASGYDDEPTTEEWETCERELAAAEALSEWSRETKPSRRCESSEELADFERALYEDEADAFEAWLGRRA